MATTILPRETEATPSELPTSSHTPPTDRSSAALLSWVLVAMVLALASVVAVRAFSSDDDPARAPWFSVEHGSIAAIDHAAGQPATTPSAPAERPSIAAADHQADTTPSSWYSSERGSISAADHDAETDETEAG